MICDWRQISIVGALALISLAQGTSLLAQSLQEQSASAAGSPDSNGPLFVNEDSHVVVMEYEAWFGQNTVTFQTTLTNPLFHATDLQAIQEPTTNADQNRTSHHSA